MKPKYRPGNRSKATTADAMRWYKRLLFIEKGIVDDMIDRYIAYVKDRSKTQASHSGGVELIYKVMKKLEANDWR